MRSRGAASALMFVGLVAATALPGRGGQRQLDPGCELIATDFQHTETVQSGKLYEAQAASASVFRRQLLGVLAVRGRNMMLIREASVQTPSCECIGPLLRALNAPKNEAIFESLSIQYTGYARGVNIEAAHGSYRRGVLSLSDVSVKVGGKVTHEASVVLSDLGSNMKLHDGKIIDLATEETTL